MPNALRLSVIALLALSCTLIACADSGSEDDQDDPEVTTSDDADVSEDDADLDDTAEPTDTASDTSVDDTGAADTGATDTADAADDTDTDDATDTADATDATDVADTAEVDAVADATDTAVDMDVVLPSDCTMAVETDLFRLDPDGPNTQISVDVAFDGTGIWAVWARRDQLGDGGFDIWAAKYGCDTSPIIAPFAVQTAASSNELEPAVAIGSGGEVYVVWMRDVSNTGSVVTDNLDILYTVLNADGSVRFAEATLETTRGGVSVSGNAWQPDVDARPSGAGAVLVGTRGDATNSGFLAFGQRITDQGALDGEAVDGGVTMTASDRYPRVDVDGGDDFAMSWLRAADVTSDDLPVYATVIKDATTATSAPATVVDGVVGTATDLVRLNDGRLLQAVGSDDGRIVVTDGTTELTLGDPLEFESTPSFAMSSDGTQVALVYYRRRSGIRNDVLVQQLDISNNGLQASHVITATGTDPAAFYGASLAHVSGNIWFVAWANGINPDFLVSGRFVEL